MKISKYTFMFDENGQEYYVYNTLSNALMEIDKESYSLLFESRNTQNYQQPILTKIYGRHYVLIILFLIMIQMII